MSLDIEHVAHLIGTKVAWWAGDCHGISTAIVKMDALRSLGGRDTTYTVTRGHWLGPVAVSSRFGSRRGLPFIAHSWIQSHGLVLPMGEVYHGILADRSTFRIVHNPIIDPTRFVFDGKDPYIYVGPNDYYDAGGNAWRHENMPTLPPFNPDLKLIHLSLPAVTEWWIAVQLAGQPTGADYPYGYYNYALIMWLGNLSLTLLGEHAKPIFKAIVDAGQGAAIPLDNRIMVLGDSR